jgi:hypothetical protein
VALTALAIAAGVHAGGLLAAAGAQSERPGGTIRGRIVSTEGAPIRRALVVLAANDRLPADSFQATTDADGRYEIAGIPPATYLLSAGKAGFLTRFHGEQAFGGERRSLTVAAGQTLEGRDLILPSAPPSQAPSSTTPASVCLRPRCRWRA